tara:strand:- start:875 stop:1078 length:204 start_codon:yes stop_codon:yes gene_type:complete
VEWVKEGDSIIEVCVTSFNETMCFTGKSFFMLVALECSLYFLLFAISRTLFFRSKKLRLKIAKSQKK